MYNNIIIYYVIQKYTTFKLNTCGDNFWLLFCGISYIIITGGNFMLFEKLKQIYYVSYVNRIKRGEVFLPKKFCLNHKKYGFSDEEILLLVKKCFESFVKNNLMLTVTNEPKYIADSKTVVRDKIENVELVCDTYGISRKRFNKLFTNKFFLSTYGLSIVILIVEMFDENDTINLLWSLVCDNYLTQEVIDSSDNLNPYDYPQEVLDNVKDLLSLSHKLPKVKELAQVANSHPWLHESIYLCLVSHCTDVIKYNTGLNVNYIPNIKSKVIRILSKNDGFEKLLNDYDVSINRFNGLFISQSKNSNDLYILAMLTGIPYQDIKLSSYIDHFNSLVMLNHK